MSTVNFTQHRPNNPASQSPTMSLKTALAVGQLGLICSELAAYQREHGPSPHIEAALRRTREALRLRIVNS